MSELSLQLADDIEIIEILLIVGVSFIGACVHEYIFCSNTHIHFFKNLNIWISTLISSILCFIIDPWLTTFNPRLILLPPLLLGLAGMDLVMRLATLKGSTSFLEYILGFLGIRNQKEDSHYGVPDVENKEETQSSTNIDDLIELDRLVHSNLDAICDLLVEYYIHHDKSAFLHGYHAVKLKLQLFHNTLLTHQAVPIETTLKISEILKKDMEIDAIYNELINQQES